MIYASDLRPLSPYNVTGDATGLEKLVFLNKSFFMFLVFLLFKGFRVCLVLIYEDRAKIMTHKFTVNNT